MHTIRADGEGGRGSRVRGGVTKQRCGEEAKVRGRRGSEEGEEATMG
jgi:hypothetical protein